MIVWTTEDAALDLLARKVAELEVRIRTLEARSVGLRYIDSSTIKEPL